MMSCCEIMCELTAKAQVAFGACIGCVPSQYQSQTGSDKHVWFFQDFLSPYVNLFLFYCLQWNPLGSPNIPKKTSYRKSVWRGSGSCRISSVLLEVRLISNPIWLLQIKKSSMSLQTLYPLYENFFLVRVGFSVPLFSFLLDLTSILNFLEVFD